MTDPLRHHRPAGPCRRGRPAVRAALPAGLAALLLAAALLPAQAQGNRSVRNGDWIAAVVNQELVTAGEVDRRIERARFEAGRAGARLPPEPELRQQVLDALIDERAMLTMARESGLRVDEPELDRAIQNIAAQNQLTIAQLRDRLRAEGLDMARFRSNVRDQILIERVREREVYQRIRISDEDIERFLQQRREAAGAEVQLNLAQILVPVPEGADPATLARLRASAEAALSRVKAGEAFETVARAVSQDSNRDKGGEIGLRPVARLPDIFVEATKSLKAGELVPELLRSGAGFHVLKVLERQEPALDKVTQTRARHVLLRTSPQLDAATASRRLAEYRRQIESGAASFEAIARQHSEDGSAANGGDLGWAAPGTMVPEFEQVMNALPLNGLSEPVVSRFGVHLIQVLERREVSIEPRQLREQARNVLREQRFEQTYQDWAKELRSRAYVELREPPL